MSTTGKQLKKTLGLEGFREVFVSRVLVPSTTKINLVIYDSKRKELPLSRRKIRNIPYTAMAFSGSYLAQGKYKTPSLMPLLKIEDFNGILSNYIFLTIDLSFSQLLRKSNFEKLPESLQKKVVRESNRLLLPQGKLSEFVTLADLKTPDITSDATKTFTKQRQTVQKGANINTKLMGSETVLEGKDVTFKFLTEATEVYKSGHVYQTVNPKNNEITNEGTIGTYDLWIKVLDVVDWVETYPDKTEITIADIKDILSVSNVQLWSDDISFTYQGFRYWLTQLDGSIYPENHKPKRWNKTHGDGDNFLTKHFTQLFKQLPWFYNQMASSLSRVLKEAKLI